MGRFLTIVKRLLVGRPVSSYAELEHRVPKRIALAVFSSDALSSSAYATDVMLVTLAAAGAAALSRSIPLAALVVSVLLVVVFSYRVTVHAYPQGGGGYQVAKDNLGLWPSLISGSALLIDYILTVSVSVAAGVKAIGAAVPFVAGNRVAVALGVVALITVANLRGIKEAGPPFAIPTYGFLISMGAVIVIGGIRVLTGNYEPLPPPEIEPTQALTLFLLVRAFASGATALTGVEAIANAVPAFRPPESKNAAQTLLTLGLLLGFLFLGITLLANAYHVDPHLAEVEGRPVPSQIAEAVFGHGTPMFLAVQFFTGLLLFLAANTAYAGFPSLASVMARDRILPSVFRNRGDKLAYSNGIVILAAIAGLVLIVYGADELRIIPLYVIGVFTTFTLAQTGLVRRWRRLRPRGWRRYAAINGFGAATTFVVLIVVAAGKFTQGAWQVIIMIPVLAWVLSRIRAHYLGVSRELRIERTIPPIEANRVVILISPILGATLKALSFARAFGAEQLHTVAFRVPERQLRDIRRRWGELGIKHPIEATGYQLDDLVEYVRGLEPSEGRPVTVVIPDPQYPNPITQLVRGLLLLRVKRILLAEPGVMVISVPFAADVEPAPDRLRSPTRFSVIVFVSGVHRATLRALDYARSLNPSEMKALSIAVDPAESATLMRQWQSWAVDAPLEIVDSPYRSLVEPLMREVQSLGPNPNDAVGIVIPEFVVGKWWQHLLHGQTAFMLKTLFLFQPNVIVIDVPYPIGAREEAEAVIIPRG